MYCQSVYDRSSLANDFHLRECLSWVVVDPCPDAVYSSGSFDAILLRPPGFEGYGSL